MGICAADEERHHKRNSINHNKEDFKYNEIQYLNQYNSNNQNIFNNINIEISSNSKETIIKSVGAIKGKSVSIKNNINCIILIIDYSYLVDIQNCNNCSIFLGPCETTIEVQNCQDLNLISASHVLKINNVKNSNFYSFISNSQIIQSSQDIHLGNFFVQYMELPDLFIKSKLNVWNNKWSYYEEIGQNSEINYSNDDIKQKVVDIFMPSFTSCYINIDQYQFVPFSYGKSIDIESEYINFLLILRQEDFPEVEILKMILPEELDNYRVKLISTLVVKDKSEIFEEVKTKLEIDVENYMLINHLLRNNEEMESLKSSQNKNNNQNNSSINSITKSRINEQDSKNEYLSNNNFKFLQKNDFLFLWFVIEGNDLEEIFYYFNSCLEPVYLGKIMKEQFNCDEMEFKEYLKKIFSI